MRFGKTGRKVLMLILALSMCLTVFTLDNSAFAETPSTALETLKHAAQQAIDALPDTSASSFAVNAENAKEYRQQLVAASNAIAAYIQAGGTDDQLDPNRFDSLSAAIGNYDGGVASATEKMTFREYVISILDGNNVTVAASISDSALGALISSKRVYSALLLSPMIQSEI